MGPTQQLLQVLPVEPWTWVEFSSLSDMLVSCDVFDRVLMLDDLDQACQAGVLHGLEVTPFEAFEFDADGVVVTVAAIEPAGLARMPGAIVAADKLPQAAISVDQKVGRNLNAANGLKVGVRVPVQPVGKESLDFVTAEHTGRQADGVDDDQVDRGADRPWTVIR